MQIGKRITGKGKMAGKSSRKYMYMVGITCTWGEVHVHGGKYMYMGKNCNIISYNGLFSLEPIKRISDII